MDQTKLATFSVKDESSNIAQYDCYGGGPVEVLGGISWDWRADLIVRTHGQVSVLDTQNRLYSGAVGDHFILMNDNALTGQLSPDMNPIEHMWNDLQVRISAC